jgi:hypothetical protein
MFMKSSKDRRRQDISARHSRRRRGAGQRDLRRRTRRRRRQQGNDPTARSHVRRHPHRLVGGRNVHQVEMPLNDCVTNSSLMRH